jgi:hypothetical protein
VKRQAAPTKKKAVPAGLVRADHNRHTCIEVKREAGIVSFIPLVIEGFELRTMSDEVFDQTYDPIPDYPVEKAARLYAEYATQLGGSKEAMLALANFTTVTEKEIDMAAAKKAAAAAKTTASPKVKASASSAKATPKKTTTAKTVKKTTGEKKPSAASMFKDLIMEGKLTDDQIFAKVQKEYGLDDNKRSYVKWYRNDLIKKGEKPPAAKG